MKKQTKTIANLGTIDLSKIELMDSIEMYIEIADLSDDLKSKVNEAVEEGKRIHEINEKKYMEYFNQKWSDAGVSTVPQLHIIFPMNGKIDYKLYIFFQDLVDDDICDSVELEIDLSNYMDDLKKAIVQAITDKFI